MATNNSVNVGLSGSTGTGNFVGSTSPTITTPILVGVTNGSSAPTGDVGELLYSSFSSSVAISTSTATQINSLTLSAGDWDVWGVLVTAPAASTVQQYISFCLNPTTATVASPTTLLTANAFTMATTFGTGTPFTNSTGIYPISVSTSTVVYLNAYIVYTASTLTAGGIIIARRVR